MKRIFACFLLICMTVGSMLGLSACAKAPRVEEIYDRVVELIEASYELNTVFYGVGLPVWETDSEYAEFSHLYYGFAYAGDYELVKPQANFGSVAEIQIAAAKVYAADYLDTVLFPPAFDGLGVDAGGGLALSGARYLEENEGFYQSTEQTFGVKGVPIYDYSTMRVKALGKANTCVVQIDYFLDTDPSVTQTASLRLVLEEDGNWYLASFTG